MKVIELFAGIGSQAAALKRLGIEHEVVCVVEWDKYAYTSYQAVHGNTPNLGDITKVVSLPGCDLLTYSFPCQDISVAGHQKGFEKGSGTRSGLLWEVERLLLDYKERGELPTYLLLENVKNLIGKQNKPDFMAWLSALNEIGYNTYYKVLNAKDYGVPQNRERVFAVSVLKEKDKWKDTIQGFEWPEPFDNGLRLKDFLEDEVDEKYYISDEKCVKLITQLKPNTVCIDSSMIGYEGKPREYADIMPAITAREYKEPRQVVVPCITPDRTEKRQNGRRFKTDGEPMFTLTGQDRHGVLESKVMKLANETGNHHGGGLFSTDGISPTLVSSGAGGGTNNIPKVIDPNECIITANLNHYGNDQMNRVYDKNGIAPTITVVSGGGREQKVMQDFRIRKLTPKECWRLMGFMDEDFEKSEKVCSNSQLYKQAGNSIVVDVLVNIFMKMFL